MGYDIWIVPCIIKDVPHKGTVAILQELTTLDDRDELSVSFNWGDAAYYCPVHWNCKRLNMNEFNTTELHKLCHSCGCKKQALWSVRSDLYCRLGSDVAKRCYNALQILYDLGYDEKISGSMYGQEDGIQYNQIKRISVFMRMLSNIMKIAMKHRTSIFKVDICCRKKRNIVNEFLFYEDGKSLPILRDENDAIPERCNDPLHDDCSESETCETCERDVKDTVQKIQTIDTKISVSYSNTVDDSSKKKSMMMGFFLSSTRNIENSFILIGHKKREHTTNIDPDKRCFFLFYID